MLLSGCVTVIRQQCTEDVFLEDEVKFKRSEKVVVLFEEKFSFYEKDCLRNGKILELIGWEKGVLFYEVEIVCKSTDSASYTRRSVKIPQHLLRKV
jgi:hypothetical protein